MARRRKTSIPEDTATQWLCHKLGDAIGMGSDAVFRWVADGMPVSMSTIYFVQPEGEPFVKIGYTTEFVTRIRGLQTGNHRPLVVRMTFPGGAPEEARIHITLKRDQYRNEWFHLRDRVRDVLDLSDRLRGVVEMDPSSKMAIAAACRPSTPWAEQEQIQRRKNAIARRLAKAG